MRTIKAIRFSVMLIIFNLIWYLICLYIQAKVVLDE
jgi:hypothetical protein